MAEIASRTSAHETIERFDTTAAADKYAGSLGGTATHRREVRCILAALADVPRGALVLDLPCGTGRLLPMLSARGFHVISADSSKHMVDRARDAASDAALPVDEDLFVVASVMNTPFQDNQFAAIVCNRLIHHFREPVVRRQALTELRRICMGPIVASFFCSASFDGVVFRIRDAMRRTKAIDRIPIPRHVFEADAKAAGLSVRRWSPIRPGISKQCYAVMERA